MLASSLGVIATVLAAVFLIPQIGRLMTSRDVNGVSMTWAVFGVVTNTAWVFYLVPAGLWVAALAPGVAVVSYGMLAAMIARVKRHRGWIWKAGVYTGILVGTYLLGDAYALGVLLALTPVMQLTPEIVAVYRDPSPTGVSPRTWMLAACEAICWGAYGTIVGDLALVGYGLVTSTGSGLILGRWWAVVRRGQPSLAKSAISTRPSLIAVAAAYRGWRP